MILTKRIYGYEDNNKYYKLFVDRLWPRGISKSEAIWNEWIKEIAPGMELRKWFDRIITLNGRPGSAFDEYDSYALACLDCMGGMD